MQPSFRQRRATSASGGDLKLNWEAALLTASAWVLLAALWHTVRPLPADLPHRTFAVRAGQDVLPALLLAFLMGRLM
jgi:hypothetical protein